MGYTWTDGELITATKLNNTGGGGFSQYTATVNGGTITLSCSYNDLISDISAGIMPYVVCNDRSITFAPLLRLDTEEDYQAYFPINSASPDGLVFFAVSADDPLENS